MQSIQCILFKDFICKSNDSRQIKMIQREVNVYNEGSVVFNLHRRSHGLNIWFQVTTLFELHIFAVPEFDLDLPPYSGVPSET